MPLEAAVNVLLERHLALLAGRVFLRDTSRDTLGTPEDVEINVAVDVLVMWLFLVQFHGFFFARFDRLSIRFVLAQGSCRFVAPHLVNSKQTSGTDRDLPAARFVCAVT
jgi:hypothetical protein